MHNVLGCESVMDCGFLDFDVEAGECRDEVLRNGCAVRFSCGGSEGCGRWWNLRCQAFFNAHS